MTQKKKRRFRLRKPEVTRVDTVDRGANQHSHILLAKRDEEKPKVPKNNPGGYLPNKRPDPNKPQDPKPQAPKPGGQRPAPRDLNAPPPGGGGAPAPGAPAPGAGGTNPLFNRPASPGVGQTPPTQRTPNVSPGGPGAGGLSGMAGALQRQSQAPPAQRPAAPPAAPGSDDPDALDGEEDDILTQLLRTHMRRRQMQKPPRKPRNEQDVQKAKTAQVDNVLESVTKGLISAGVFTEDATAKDLRDILPKATLGTLTNIVSTSKSAEALEDTMPPENQEELEAQLQAMVDELPDEVIDYVTNLEERASAAEEAVAKMAKADEGEEDDPFAKALSELPPEVAAIVKSQADRLAEAEEALKASKIAKADETFITKARSYDGLIDKAEEFGPVLREFAEAHPEAAEKLEGQLQAASNRLAKSDLFKEYGHGGDGTSTATSEVEAIAKSYQEANPELSEAEARAIAWENNPEMYERHVQEHRERTR